MTSETTASLSDEVLFFKLVNTTVILAFSLSLIIARSFIGLMLYSASHSIIKGITVWVVRRPDVSGDVIAEIFWQPRQGSSAWVAWCKVLLADVVSSAATLSIQNITTLPRYLI